MLRLGRAEGDSIGSLSTLTSFTYDKFTIRTSFTLGFPLSGWDSKLFVKEPKAHNDIIDHHLILTVTLYIWSLN